MIVAMMKYLAMYPLLLFSLTQPILKPIQRFVPPIGGLDLSPVVAIIGLQLLKLLILPPLLALL